jgi:hypothetical protein
MRYWYHPESESLWTTEAEGEDHSETPTSEVVELTYQEFQEKLQKNSEAIRREVV